MTDDPRRTESRKTGLYDLHVSLGARMVPFAGWDMPVQFPMGVMAEHLHTRAQAGLFDVSHMGQVILRGPDAAAALETLVPADIVGLAAGRQRYGLFTDPEGGILDDLMIANKGDHLLLVVNAACAVQQDVLAHDEARLLAAQEGAGRAEILGPAIAAGRDGGLAPPAGLVDADAFGFRDARVQAVRAVGRVDAGQQVVHADALAGDLARHAGHEPGQPGARRVGQPQHRDRRPH